MTPPVWNSAWVRPYESFWAIVYKAAFAANESAESMAGSLIHSVVRRRIEGLLPYAPTVRRLAHDLQVEEPAALRLFAGISSGRLSQREPLRIGLRWCPVCAKTWFHSALFQDSRRSRCPWHGVLLLEGCPKCYASIDPVTKVPWTCDVCSKALAPPDLDWLHDFKEPVVLTSASELQLPGICLTCSEPRPRPGGAKEFELFDLARLHSQRKSSPFLDHSNYHRLAMEEVSALVDALAGVHRECAKHEHWVGQYGDLRHASFSCPLATALVRLANDVGCVTDLHTNYWPRGLSGAMKN